jgi:hypothetical protein
VIYSGILGLFGYLHMNYRVLKKLHRLKEFKHEGFLITVVVSMYLLSQITQLSFQYGGLSELFGIFLALAGMMFRFDSLAKRNNAEVVQSTASVGT